MLRVIGPLLMCAMMVLIVACGGRDPPVANEANDTAGLPASNRSSPDATGAPPRTAPPASAQEAATQAIPASLQGRWGLSPMDCTSTRGDAKGLLVIGPAELRFYESRAVPGRDVQNGTDSIIGNFTYTGEGQTWTKFEALKLDGEELVRTQSNPVASFTYARCK
jgi:hypothetical protein